MKVAGATALVSGANRGIGQELVRALLAAGASRVYAAARELKSLESTRKLDPKRVLPMELDVTSQASVDAAARVASDVNLLMNNAGILEFGDFFTLPMESTRRQFETNFFGKLRMALAFAPIIDARGGGAIVNMLTLVALVSAPHIPGYNASKAAAWSMTQSLRATLAAQRIEVVGVYPGAVDTDMLASRDMPKTSPAVVANAVIAGLEAGEEDIFPDPMSAHYYEKWKRDHKAVEKEFAAGAG